MAHAENEIVINKTPVEVYSFLIDGLNNPKWRKGVVSIGLASGQPGQIGAVYKQVLKGPGGRDIPGDYKITTAQSGKELSFEVIAGPARPTGNYYFEPAGVSTKLKFVLDYQPKGFAKLMGPMINKTMRTEVGMLSKLKQVLEGNSA